MNHVVRKGDMGAIVDVLADAYPKAVVAQTLDGLKNRCFRFATKSGLTVSIDDVRTPEDKQKILDDHEKQAEKVEDQFHKGVITDGERRQKEVEIWNDATAMIQHQLEENLAANPFNPIDMMVRSGARGEPHADPPDRGHAWPRGQPPRRHDPPADQVELPRGPLGARVLHRHAGRPQGPGRHRRCGPPTPGTSPGVWSTSPRS